MTITTDNNNSTQKTTGTVAELANGVKVGVAYNHILSEGAQVFLGIQGQHGTTIRMNSKTERQIMAELLRMMADQIDPAK